MHPLVMQLAVSDAKLVNVINLITDIKEPVLQVLSEFPDVLYEVLIPTPHLAATLDGHMVTRQHPKVHFRPVEVRVGDRNS
jgi:hypothetical protein